MPTCPPLSRLLSIIVPLALALCVGPARAVEYSTFEPSPSGRVRVSLPTIAWRIAPRKGARVTAVSMTLNNRLVPAAYETGREVVAYTPDAPLAPGAYAVSCSVVLNGEWTVKQEWKFLIAREAVRDLPAPSAWQRKALETANAFRAQMTLPPLQLDARLCAAATAHSAYLLRQSGRLTHDQRPSEAGFLAKSPSERVAAFGYAGGCYENISQGTAAPQTAVRELFDAPYHRLPFLQPGASEMGAGAAGDHATLLFGAATGANETVVYPVPDQNNVPTAWNGVETPNPRRVHGGAAAAGPTGYVITFAFFGGDKEYLRVVRATLSAPNNKPVPVYVNTPANDPFLQSAALIIPRKPLRPGTTYTVSVVATTGGGRDVSQVWRFTTAPGQSSGGRLVALSP